MSRGDDRIRPMREMSKRWKKLSLITSEDTAQWVHDVARRNGDSITATLDNIVSRAKLRDRLTGK